MNKEMIEISGSIGRSTDQAHLFFDGDQKVWIPRSQIDSIDVLSSRDLEQLEQSGRHPRELPVDITVPKWLAIEKGLV